jgi:hypothetical protein
MARVRLLWIRPSTEVWDTFGQEALSNLMPVDGSRRSFWRPDKLMGDRKKQPSPGGERFGPGRGLHAPAIFECGLQGRSSLSFLPSCWRKYSDRANSRGRTFLTVCVCRDRTSD